MSAPIMGTDISAQENEHVRNPASVSLNRHAAYVHTFLPCQMHKYVVMFFYILGSR